MRNIAVIVENRQLPNFQEILDSHLDYLPGWEYKRISDQSIRSASDYNRLLTDVSFWDRFVKYDRVLIFQHDSRLLRHGIDDFYEFDYIGAPIKNFDFPAMNGGLSLRSPRKMLSCIRNRPWQSSYYRVHNEDIYFSYELGNVNAKLPDYETARLFSVETVFGLGSLGIHAANKYLSEHEMNQIYNQYGNLETNKRL